MSFTEELAARLLEEEGLDPGPAVWRPLEGLLIPEGKGGFRFRNGLVREVAYESLPFRTRRALHARVGEAIESEAGDDADDFAELLSFHFFNSNEPRKAWRYSRLAGDWASTIYANVEARDFYLQAIEAARRLEDAELDAMASVAEALGDVRVRLGEYREAEDAYRLGRRIAAADTNAQAHLLLKEALILDVEGRFPQALRTLTKGTNLLRDRDDDRAAGLRAQLAANYGGIRFAQGRGHDAIRWCRVALEDAERAGELDAMAHALYVLDISEHSLGLSPGGPNSERALELYEQLGKLAKQADVMSNLGYYAYFHGDWNEALEWYGRGRDIYQRTGNMVDAAINDANVGETSSIRVAWTRPRRSFGRRGGCSRPQVPGHTRSSRRRSWPRPRHGADTSTRHRRCSTRSTRSVARLGTRRVART